MRSTAPATALAVALLLALPCVAMAQEPADGSSKGEFLIGYRSVDIGGAERKYKEDINLDDGPRLFSLYFQLTPAEGLQGVADSIELDLSNYGGDPFETLRFAVRKTGTYKLTYNRRKSAYFYDDVIQPVDQAGDPALALAGDFHTFDFDRVYDNAELAIQLGPRAELTLGFDRFTREGESTTTLDVQRDEFELDSVIDESMNSYSAGFQYAWDKVTLVLEERVRDYENNVEIFLPGFSRGEDPLDAANLDFFFLDQPYDYTSNEHTARLLARPTRRLQLNFGAVLQSLDLDVQAAERSQGDTFTGAPFTTNESGDGEVNRDVELFDFDFTFDVTSRLALIGSVRQQSLDQDGDFTFGGELNVGHWEIDTTSADLGLSFFVSPQLTVSGGLRYETRDVEHEAAADADGPLGELEGEETQHDGYFATVAWRPSRQLSLTVEAEDSSYDDPFTLVSPTGRQRLRGRLRWAGETGFSVTGSYLLNEYENDNSGWQATHDQASLQLGYRRGGLTLSGGYNLVEFEREIDQVVVTLPGFGGGAMLPFAIFYEADSDFLDGHVRWQSERFTVGGDLRLYDNSGSFGLERTDLRAFTEIELPQRYLLHLGFRTVDYDEKAADFDDYDADIFEIGVGYRW